MRSSLEPKTVVPQCLLNLYWTAAADRGRDLLAEIYGRKKTEKEKCSFEIVFIQVTLRDNMYILECTVTSQSVLIWKTKSQKKKKNDYSTLYLVCVHPCSSASPVCLSCDWSAGWVSWLTSRYTTHVGTMQPRQKNKLKSSYYNNILWIYNSIYKTKALWWLLVLIRTVV